MKRTSKLALTILSSGILLTGCGGESDAPLVYEQCGTQGELEQFYDYMQDNYFWNERMPSGINPNNYADVYDLLDALVVPEDRFSFILTEDEYQSRFVSA